MSRKSKLILATALFGAALFAASCGGGGGGGATAGTETGSGGGSGSGGSGSTPPPASVEGKVLAMLNTGAASAGASKPVAVCELKSDNKAYCGNDLNPSADVDLQYVHEFPNGNVVLRDTTNNVLYFYNAQNNTLTKLTNFRALNGTSGTVATGITIPNNSIYYATANFLMMYGNNDLVAISNTGNVIKDTGVANIDTNCEMAVKGPLTYTLNADGTTTAIIQPLPNVVASAGGKFLHIVGNDIYLSDSRCRLVNTVVIMTAVNNFNDAKMVESSGSYYIAIRYGAAGGAGRNLDYYRVTGTTRTQLFSSNNALRTGDQNLYDIDGRGYLYFNATGNVGTLCGGTANNNDEICAIDPTNGATLLLSNLTGGANSINGILAFNDRVLARGSDNRVYDVFVNNTGALARTANPAVADGTALDRCLSLGGGNTIAVDGRGTPIVRCVWDNNGVVGGEMLSVFVHNGNGNYLSNSIQISPNSPAGGAIVQNNIRFGANGVLVVTRNGAVNLCTITTTPAFNISCSATDLPNPLLGAPGNLPIGDTTRIYYNTNLLKFNGNNVFYLSGVAAPFNPRFRDLFSTTASSLPIAITPPPGAVPPFATGGNASFDLTKFAFSFTPAAIVPCATQIAYLSSPAATPKIYTIAQPSNTCVNNILKVFP